MPRLLLFAPCERALIDRATNSLSMIALIEGLTVELPESVNPPARALGPMQWTIVTLWAAEPDPQRYEQKVELFAPDGALVIESRLRFEMQANLGHRNTANLNGFPVGPPGQYDLVLSLRDDRDGSAFQELSRFPLQVTRPRGPATRDVPPAE